MKSYLEYIKESKYTEEELDIKKGDLVKCVRNYYIMLDTGGSGSLLRYNLELTLNKLYYVIGVSEFPKMGIRAVWVINDDNNIGNYSNQGDEVIFIKDNKIIDEFKKKRQESIDKNRHIDPYGEDDWFD